MLPYRKHWRSRKVNKPFGVYSRTTINIATGRLLKFQEAAVVQKGAKMQEHKDWDGNLLPDPAPTVQHVHIGDIIKIKINDEDRIGRASKYGEFEVICSEKSNE